MKLKKIIALLLVVFIVFLIYLTTLDKKVYYLSIGDYITTGEDKTYTWNQNIVEELKEKKKFEVFVKEFSNANLRTTDLVYQIQDNEKKMIDGKEKSIKNALIKADLVTLSVGMNDLLYKVNMNIEDISMEELYDYVDEMMEDMEDLMKLLREYCKEDILMTNYYVPQNIMSEKAEKMIYYANKRFYTLAKEYHIDIIDIHNFSDHPDFFRRNTPYLSILGEEEITKITNEVLEKTLFK